MSDNKRSPNSSQDFKSSAAESIVIAAEPSENLRVTGDAFVAGASVVYYEPIPEYEGRHRYDPSAEWTEKEERRLLRKVSLARAGKEPSPAPGIPC